MKATGIVRRIDDLGRIAIPKEIRKTMKFNEGDAIEIFTNENTIILKKYLSPQELRYQWAEEIHQKMRTETRLYNVHFSTTCYQNIIALTATRNNVSECGIAICSKKDSFSPVVGRAVAYAHMKHLPIPDYI